MANLCNFKHGQKANKVYLYYPAIVSQINMNSIRQEYPSPGANLLEGRFAVPNNIKQATRNNDNAKNQLF